MGSTMGADKVRLRSILAKLDRLYPNPRCALEHKSPYELLVATILSAQCTDKRVNMVTPALFAKYPTPRDLAHASQDDVEALVRSTGFFRNKAKNIIACCRRIEEVYAGHVPDSMEALTSLPGVARKTANVVLGECFDKAVGVVVDTHVARISQLLGLTRHKDPKRIEQDLMELLPRDRWIRFSHQLIHLGRNICIARRPRCTECLLAPECPSATS